MVIELETALFLRCRKPGAIPSAPSVPTSITSLPARPPAPSRFNSPIDKELEQKWDVVSRLAANPYLIHPCTELKEVKGSKQLACFEKQ